MIVISHRGYWKVPGEKNSADAFHRTFSLGFGTETDLRDAAGRVVVSHDPAGDDAMGVETMLSIHREYNNALPLALNIKADGLQGLVRKALAEFAPADAFVFDMSVPDAIQWVKAGIPVFTRHSDVEPEPVLYQESAGVWLDGFHSDWWGAETVRRHLDRGKRVCIVSPELHGRDHRPAWERMLMQGVSHSSAVILCTDFPEQAREIFGHEN